MAIIVSGSWLNGFASGHNLGFAYGCVISCRFVGNHLVRLLHRAARDADARLGYVVEFFERQLPCLALDWSGGVYCVTVFANGRLPVAHVVANELRHVAGGLNRRSRTMRCMEHAGRVCREIGSFWRRVHELSRSPNRQRARQPDLRSRSRRIAGRCRTSLRSAIPCLLSAHTTARDGRSPSGCLCRSDSAQAARNLNGASAEIDEQCVGGNADERFSCLRLVALFSWLLIIGDTAVIPGDVGQVAGLWHGVWNQDTER